MAELVKRTVDEWLDSVDYHELNEGMGYIPTPFALKFMNFIKLVNGGTGESNLTPVVHLKMLDEIAGKKKRIANLCARGLAKTTLMFEYLVLFIAFYGEIEGFGKITGMIYVSDSMDNGVTSARQNIEFRYNNSEFLQKYLRKAKFTDNKLEFENLQGHRLGVKMFGAKTGIRGTKIDGKRPVLAVLDDLVSDDDAKSKTAMQAIKDTVHKGVNFALDPTRFKIIFNGTPFNKDDILYEAVESGKWHVNVWPVCETFPVEEKDFHGAWEDRFNYEYVLDQYETAVATGKVAGFMQELMLRITSEEDRLIQNDDIHWYEHKHVLENKGAFNFYITTDWAVSDKQSADYSVISVWAYDAEGTWYWVDGWLGRAPLNIVMDKLFELEERYQPQSVGVEVTGQQGGFIPWIKEKMHQRSQYFNFASEPGKAHIPGVRPVNNKLARFNRVVPLFKSMKVKFPKEKESSFFVKMMIDQLSTVTVDGMKSKNDDILDTISMLAMINVWKPSKDVAMNSPQKQTKSQYWDDEDIDTSSGSRMSSYLV